jgi:hypothetical protein
VDANKMPWSEIRRRVLTGGLSKRQACELYRIHWKTLAKILTHEKVLGYQPVKPARRRQSPKRESWVLLGSDRGSQVLATLTGFTATCELIHINPWTWPSDTFTRLPVTPVHQLDTLLLTATALPNPPRTNDSPTCTSPNAYEAGEIRAGSNVCRVMADEESDTGKWRVMTAVVIRLGFVPCRWRNAGQQRTL